MCSKNKISKKEAAKLGGEKAAQVNKQKKFDRIKIYYKNPKLCKKCGKVISYEKRNNTYCCRSCAAQSNNEQRNFQGWKHSESTRLKISNTLKLQKKHQVPCKKCGTLVWTNSNSKNIVCIKCSSDKYRKNFCRICGAEKGKCKRPDICKKYRILSTLIKYFGFNEAVIGTEQVYEEFIRIQNKLYELYISKNLSTLDILKIYNSYKSTPQNFAKILKTLDIPIRNKSEASYNAIKNNKNIIHKDIKTQFKTGWHIDWQGNKWFYRSSYELNYMIELDLKKIKYQVEDLRILYWDSQKCIQRIAIPDFFLPDTNEIVEIKGYNWKSELTKQNMRDKFKEYKRCGFKPHLIAYGKEEFNF